MDILNPELSWIDGRCYRKLVIHDENDDDNSTINNYQEELLDDDEEYENKYDIEYSDRGAKLTHYIPNSLLRMFSGNKKDSLQRIKQETNTHVKLPNLKLNNLPIIINGPTDRDCVRALEKIQILVLEERNKIAPTHFISLPLNEEPLFRSFLDFKRDCLRIADEEDGITDSIFQDPYRLHLTISMLILLDEKDEQYAMEILEMCFHNVIKNELAGEPLEVEVADLEIMNDDEDTVNVLYAKVHSNKIQFIADQIAQEFLKNGLTKKSLETVKLHLTLMNTKFDNKTNKNSHFSVKKIMKICGNYKFGKVEIPKICISIRHAYKAGSYFKDLYAINLPVTQ